jgi:hypothetical protein
LSPKSQLRSILVIVQVILTYGKMFVQLFLFGLVSLRIAALKVSVGHIGALHVMPNGDKVLEIARQELVKEGLLNQNLSYE